MADKVVPLFGQPLFSGEPSEAVIHRLEELLEQARAGSVVGVAFVGVNQAGDAEYRVVGRVGGFSMQGALDCARQEVLKINMGDTE